MRHLFLNLIIVLLFEWPKWVPTIMSLLSKLDQGKFLTTEDAACMMFATYEVTSKTV
jgi:hypothetical protein